MAIQPRSDLWSIAQMPTGEAEALIRSADVSIFSVPSSTTVGDKQTLLRIQNIVMDLRGDYSFLEIGSYMGGALVPHLVSPHCRQVFSVDKRPEATPDNRAVSFAYEGVTTAEMLELLATHVGAERCAKIEAFDCDASSGQVAAIDTKIDFAFIDGEHTNVACFSDFLSIYPLLSPDAIVGFHDANLVIDAILNIRSFLTFQGAPFRLYLLPDLMCAIAFGGSIDAAEATLGPLAFEEAAYVKKAKRDLHEEIAGAVRAGAHLL